MSVAVGTRFEANLDAIRNLLADSGAVLAYLFGSVARAEERADSDLDVAALLAGTIPEERYGEIRLRLLTELVGLTHTNDVDLIILNEAPPLLAFRIVTTGRLFLGSPEQRVPFEVRAIQRYIDTRPLRASLAEGLRRGACRDPSREREAAGRW